MTLPARRGQGWTTSFADGVRKAATTSHVPLDRDADGMNDMIGSLDDPAGTSLVVRGVEYGPP